MDVQEWKITWDAAIFDNLSCQAALACCRIPGGSNGATCSAPPADMVLSKAM